MPTLIISVLFGVILPIYMSFKDLTLIAILFSSIWFIYVVIFFVYTFLIKTRRINKKSSRSDEISIQDIMELQALYDITINKGNRDKEKFFN